MTHSCPHCGAALERSLLLCPNCGTALRDAPTGALSADEELVPIFETTEIGVLPLARLALDQAGVEYAVRNVGMSDQIMGARSNRIIGETEEPLEIVVRRNDASRARDLLSDLDRAAIDPAISTPPGAPDSRAVLSPPIAPAGTRTERGGNDVDLLDLASGALIGTLSRAAFDSLANHLERESEDDDDYYIDGPTIAMLEQSGTDAGAVDLLRRALGTRDGMDIQWRNRTKD